MSHSLTKILIRGPNWIGDQVLALPFARAILKAYPESEISWAVPEAFVEWVSQLEIGEVIGLDSDSRAFPRGVHQAAQIIRAKGFDLGISLASSVSSAAYLFWGGIPHRVGYAEPLASPWLTASLKWPKNPEGRHKSELYLNLLEWLRGELPKTDSKTNSFSHPAEREAVGIVAPGASIALREWPYFGDLLVHLNDEFPDFQWRVVGAKSDRRWHQILQDLSLPRTEDWIEKTSLLELQQMCQRARIVIANDSGVAHLAASLGQAPTVVVFGPGDPRYVLPLGETVRFSRVGDLPCSPCENRRCRGAFGYQTCLKALDVETVLGVIRPLLEG